MLPVFNYEVCCYDYKGFLFFICPHSLLQDVDSAFQKHLFPFLKAIGRIVESRWNVAMQLNLMDFCFFPQEHLWMI